MIHPVLTPLYTPTRSSIDQSLMKRFMNWLFIKKGLYFRDYDDLWDWSVTDLEDFWESIWQFFDVQSHTPYYQVIFRPNNRDMIGTTWFSGATLNYAEHIFRHKTQQRPAILFASEQQPGVRSVSWDRLEHQVAAVAAYLQQQHVGVGDRVVAVLPNGPEAVVAFLATNAVGAIWSSCSPDFSTVSVVDRFRQIQPKILFAADGYTYNGEQIDNTHSMQEVHSQLPTLQQLVWVDYINSSDRQLIRRTGTMWYKPPHRQG